MARRWVAVAVTIALLTAACATRQVTPIGAGGQPFTPEADERTLWTSAAREETALLKKARLYDDPELEQYLARLGERLTPDEVRAAGGPPFRFAVIRDPALNAFALPNGHVYVHTGLLSRLDNEAQLAMILGHELTHVTHRHALALQRDAQTKQIVYSVAAAAVSLGTAAAVGSRAGSGDGAGGALLGQTAGAILGSGLQLAAVASINGYGRDLERDADAAGLESLVRAGYDPGEAPKVFALLRSESRERGSLETFFFGSHPRLTERVESTSRLVATRYAAVAANPGLVRDTDEFQRRMRPVARENAEEDIRAGRFALAQRQLDRVLALAPDDAIAHTHYGDLHRLRAQRARDASARREQEALALAAYERAVALDPSRAEPHRQIGLLHYQQKDAPRARAAFQTYLALKPSAPDARRIKEYLLELDR